MYAYNYGRLKDVHLELRKLISNPIEFVVTEKEEELDQEEERCELSDVKVKNLEVEVTQVGNSLRSMEINEGEACSRTKSGDEKITEMQKKHDDMEARAVKFEEKSAELEQELESKEDELNEAKNQYSASKEQMDAVISEVNEM